MKMGRSVPDFIAIVEPVRPWCYYCFRPLCFVVFNEVGGVGA
jgi:hypothetical protein